MATATTKEVRSGQQPGLRAASMPANEVHNGLGARPLKYHAPPHPLLLLPQVKFLCVARRSDKVILASHTHTRCAADAALGPASREPSPSHTSHPLPPYHCARSDKTYDYVEKVRVQLLRAPAVLFFNTWRALTPFSAPSLPARA